MHDGATVSEVVRPTLVTEALRIQPEIHAPAVISNPLTRTVQRSAEALLEKQAEEGFWRFDLEADTTIPAEYLFLQYFLGTVDVTRQAKLADYILSRQLQDGSWSLYEGGAGNISASVKSYFALKLAGKDPASPEMKLARRWVLTHGGAEGANVFTRITLAVYGQIPWHTVPAMMAEVIWLPKWFLLFNLHKVSYWSRCVIVPLLIIFATRPVHTLTINQGITELFIGNPQSLKNLDRFNQGSLLKNLFILIDRMLKIAETFVPAGLRALSVRKAERWMREHMRGEGGIGAIFPAMANAVMALKVLGHDTTDPDMRRGVKAIEDLVIENEKETYVQPCVSPIWDTCLSISALTEAGVSVDTASIQSATDWLFEKQVFVRGDWSENAPDLDGGGWAFQFENDLYPDVDDSSMVIMALLRADAQANPDKRRRIAQGVNWVLGMQNPDGGWGAFDIDNHYEYLNNIPFADHGALVDPSTADLTGRCIEMLAMLGYDRSFPPIARGIEFLRREQEPSGSWYGRWGVNYIYGTWAVLVGLGALGEDPSQPYIRKAINWLKSIQNSDGGWGESCDSYDDPDLQGRYESTASQTAWALLGLMAVGAVNSENVTRGINYLLRTYEGAGGWKEIPYTGTGFPKVFYLRYHGYSHYFPLWALGVHQRLLMGKPTRQQEVCSGDPIELGPMPVVEKIRLHH